MDSNPPVSRVLGAGKQSRRQFLQAAASGMAVYGGIREIDVVRADAHEWSFETGNWVISSPTVVDDRVFVGSRDGNVYAVLATNGEEWWSFETGSWVQSSPTVVDDRVFIGSKDSNLYALEASTGNRVWRFETDDWVHSSPAVADGTVFVGSKDGYLYAVDGETGEQRWSFETHGFIRSSPTVVRGTVYIGSYDSHLYAIDAKTGEERWSFETGDWIYSSPTVVGGTVLVGSKDSNLYAVDVDTGEERWSFETGAWVSSSPTVVDETIFVGGRDTKLYSIDMGTGEQRWSYETDDVIDCSPTVVDGTVIVGNNGGRLFFVDLETGEGESIFTNSSESWSSPTVVDGTVYVGGKFLYAIPTDRYGSSEGSRVRLGTLGHHHDRSDRITLRSPASFEVDVTSNSPVDEGQEVTIEVEITNVGDESGTTDLEVTVAGLGIDTTEEVTLVGGETVTITTSEDTTTGDEGEYTVTAATADDSASKQITIESPPPPSDDGESTEDDQTSDADQTTEDGQSAGDGDSTDDSEGIVGPTELAAVGGGSLLVLFGGYAYMRRRSEAEDSPEQASRSGDSSAGDVAAGTALGSGGSGGSGGGGSEAGQASSPETTSAGSAAVADKPAIGDVLTEIESLLDEARERREALEFEDALESCEEAIEMGDELRESATVKAPHRVSDIDAVLTPATELRDELEDQQKAYRDGWERYQDLADRVEEIAQTADPTDPDEQLRKLGGITTHLDKVEDSIAEYEFETLTARIEQLRVDCRDLRENLEAGKSAYDEASEELAQLSAELDEVEESLEADNYGAALQHLDDLEVSIDATVELVDEYRTPELDERIDAQRSRWAYLRERAVDARGPMGGEPDEIPSAPKLTLDYADIKRVDFIDKGGNADVYRAIVPTNDGEEIYVALKEPRMGGALHDDTIQRPPGKTENQEVSGGEVADPETATTKIDQSVDEHVPGESGTRAWTRDEELDPDEMPDGIESVEEPEPAEYKTKIQPGGDRDSGDLETESNTESKNQIVEEARKWQKIDDHDHIVDVVDFDREPNPWIAMEYMDGGHLGFRAGDMAMDQAVWTAIVTTKAVRHAHRRGLAHLDLKPENILFRTIDDAWDAPKVADWGLSKLLLNHSQSVAGLSAHYAAPEQFDRSFGEADDITDIYALGAVFYELFTGKKAFEGRPVQVMNQVVNNELTPPSEVADVPKELDDIIMKAMAVEKEDRYESVLYLRDDLQELRETLSE